MIYVVEWQGTLYGPFQNFQAAALFRPEGHWRIENKSPLAHPVVREVLSAQPVTLQRT